MTMHRQQVNLLPMQESLSDSTKCTITTTESKPSISKRRKVSFHHKVVVYVYEAYSQEDRDRMFYTREEMRSFSRALRRYIQSLRWIERQSSQPCPSSLTATGIEGFLHPEHKGKHRLQGVLSVLMEQDRQYIEEGHFTPVNFDSMSLCYHRAAQESQEEAHRRALACLLFSEEGAEGTFIRRQ